MTVLTLPGPVEPGREALLEAQFHLGVPAEGRVALAGWHPRLWWGRETHDDFAVKLDVPADYAVGTSGRLDPTSGVYNGSGLRAFGLFLGRDMKILEAQAGDVQVRAVCTCAGEPCARLLLDTAVDAISFYCNHFGFYPHASLTIVPGMDRPAGGHAP